MPSSLLPHPAGGLLHPLPTTLTLLVPLAPGCSQAEQEEAEEERQPQAQAQGGGS